MPLLLPRETISHNRSLHRDSVGLMGKSIAMLCYRYSILLGMSIASSRVSVLDSHGKQTLRICVARRIYSSFPEIQYLWKCNRVWLSGYKSMRFLPGEYIVDITFINDCSLSSIHILSNDLSIIPFYQSPSLCKRLTAQERHRRVPKVKMSIPMTFSWNRIRRSLSLVSPVCSGVWSKTCSKVIRLLDATGLAGAWWGRKYPFDKYPTKAPIQINNTIPTVA